MECVTKEKRQKPAAEDALNFSQAAHLASKLSTKSVLSQSLLEGQIPEF